MMAICKLQHNLSTLNRMDYSKEQLRIALVFTLKNKINCQGDYSDMSWNFELIQMWQP